MFSKSVIILWKSYTVPALLQKFVHSQFLLIGRSKFPHHTYVSWKFGNKFLTSADFKKQTAQTPLCTIKVKHPSDVTISKIHFQVSLNIISCYSSVWFALFCICMLTRTVWHLKCVTYLFCIGLLVAMAAWWPSEAGLDTKGRVLLIDLLH